jgi:HAD superfamily hydrolase (TIGR01458 family)
MNRFLIRGNGARNGIRFIEERGITRQNLLVNVDWFAALLQSSEMIKGVLLDIAGVVREAGAAIPGAVEAISGLRSAGLPVRFLTNTTRRPRRVILENLREMGVEVSQEELFTPVAAVRKWLEDNGHSPHLLVHPDLEEDFEGCDPNGPIALVLGDAAERFSYRNINAAFRLLHDGAPFLALAANRTFRDEDGELSIDAGAFVHALEFASGVSPILFGKPAPDFFAACIENIGCARDEAVMVGDDAESDVAGALSAGVGTAILVKTGKYRSGDEDKVEPRPSAVVPGLRAAVDFIRDQIRR